MAQITQEIKEQIISRLTNNDYASIASLCNEFCVSKSFVYKLKNIIANSESNEMQKQKGTNKVKLSTKISSAQQKVEIFAATASLNEDELRRYCREHNLDLEQVKAIKLDLINSQLNQAHQESKLKKQYLESQHELSELKKEMRRKDKALAETAALLVLSKKAHAIWGESLED